MNQQAKAAYAAPALTQVGTFEQLTQATGLGDKLDKDFPTNTPKPDLTFS